MDGKVRGYYSFRQDSLDFIRVRNKNLTPKLIKVINIHCRTVFIQHIRNLGKK